MRVLTRVNALHVAIGLFVMGSILLQPEANALERYDTTIKLPGVEVRRHRGWFNRHKTEYRDVLGNKVSSKRRWWGRTDRQANVLGATFQQKGKRHLSLRTPSGRPIIERHKSIFGKTKNIIDLSAW